MTSNNKLADHSGFVSAKPIPPRERLIVALDLPGPDEAIHLVDALGDAAWFYKIGLELFMAGGYFELIEKLRKRGKQVFADLKFFDVPETVKRAVARLAERDVQFATVHGNDTMLEAACAAKKGLKILAVTVLTSLDEGDMKSLGFEKSITEVVIHRARRALALGCDGVISSGRESAAIREQLGDKLNIVVPGIRPGANREESGDDQKRIVTAEMAFRSGADYIVVGRPIKSAPDPRRAAEEIQKAIAGVFGG